tara:strand:+ start:1143 stop:1862 length:720 start_codon:yes stop_codon:yes gene_type:complete
MKSLNQKDVISAIGLYADNSIKTSEIIEGFSIKVFNNLDDSQKETIIQLVEDKDFTEAKALVKLEVNKITGFDNKNTIAKYKNTLASKYYDDSKTVVYKRKHFDKDTGIDFRNDTVSISSKFSYELSEKEFKALKNKSGKFLTDGEDIHGHAKLLRNNIKNSVDQNLSRFNVSIIMQVAKMLGLNTVTGTQKPIKEALFGKLDKVNDYYANNNDTLIPAENKEWKKWYASMPTWIKATK